MDMTDNPLIVDDLFNTSAMDPFQIDSSKSMDSFDSIDTLCSFMPEDQNTASPIPSSEAVDFNNQGRISTS